MVTSLAGDLEYLPKNVPILESIGIGSINLDSILRNPIDTVSVPIAIAISTRSNPNKSIQPFNRRFTCPRRYPEDLF
jgi:hypothetical protein